MTGVCMCECARACLQLILGEGTWCGLSLHLPRFPCRPCSIQTDFKGNGSLLDCRPYGLPLGPKSHSDHLAEAASPRGIALNYGVIKKECKTSGVPQWFCTGTTWGISMGCLSAQ